jgi:renalase
MTNQKHKTIAIIGAGMAGITAARTLQKAGHRVTVFEKSGGFGGRMATRHTAFGSFDHGAQYFTVRDPRFTKAMAYTLGLAPGVVRPWSANAVRVLDAAGRMAAAALPTHEPHWVANPGMNALPKLWAQPLQDAGRVHLHTRVHRISSSSLSSNGHWQLNAVDAHDNDAVFGGFDQVLLALPSKNVRELLLNSEHHPRWVKALDQVVVAPCWTLMLAFPNTLPVTTATAALPLGPQWSAARSTHHRIAWLARESSKPAREPLERWTVQASEAWSREHLEDDPERVKAKLIKAFAEVTGIRAEPAHADIHRWRFAKTEKPLGKSHLWDAKTGLGVCGDWCLGHRVEDAFVSGLELALAVV